MLNVLKKDGRYSGLGAFPTEVFPLPDAHLTTFDQTHSRDHFRDHSPCNSDYGSLKGTMDSTLISGMEYIYIYILLVHDNLKAFIFLFLV